MNRERLSKVKCPEGENMRSDGVCVATMHRYMKAIKERGKKRW